jgi:hypothetical protein
MAVLALVCVLAGRLATADAGPGPQQPADQRVQVVYPVADLIVPIDGDTYQRTGSPDQLMDLVRKTVAPTSWIGQGGSGTIQYFPMKMSLVVKQTPALQRDVAHVLRALRRLQDVEVAVELRIVQVSDELAGEFRAKAGFERVKTESDTTVEMTFLSEKEVYPWLRLFQTDPLCQIMMAPKMTMLDGQQAQIAVGGQENSEPSLRCVLRPSVSADRRFVRLKIEYRQMAPGSAPLALKHESTIADGRTMVVPLGKVLAERREEEVNVLSKVPYVNRLVRNVGCAREARDVFLLVTPRVIVNEEEEQVFFSEPPAVRR